MSRDLSEIILICCYDLLLRNISNYYLLLLFIFFNCDKFFHKIFFEKHYRHYRNNSFTVPFASSIANN